LSELGYSALVVRNMLKDVGALGRWMQEYDVEPGQLTPAVIAEFRNDCLVLGQRKFRLSRVSNRCRGSCAASG
jgi:hypothetical protein